MVFPFILVQTFSMCHRWKISLTQIQHKVNLGKNNCKKKKKFSRTSLGTINALFHLLWELSGCDSGLAPLPLSNYDGWTQD